MIGGGIRVGELDCRIIIQQLTTTRSTITNYPSPTYSTFATVAAKRLGKANNDLYAPSTSEAYEANQQVAINTVRYFIRTLTGVLETMLIVDGTKTYNISGIEDFGRQGYMILTATKRDNA
jgi:head-tail adaptor